jgi:hypothetical protein
MHDPEAPPSIVEGFGGSGGGVDSGLAGKVMQDFQRASSSRIFQEQQVFIRALFNSRAPITL